MSKDDKIKELENRVTTLEQKVESLIRISSLQASLLAMAPNPISDSLYKPYKDDVIFCGNRDKNMLQYRTK